MSVSASRDREQRARTVPDSLLDTPVEEALGGARPPVLGAEAAVGASGLVVTWHLSRPLDASSTPALLTVWLPRHGDGPMQLGLEVEQGRSHGFCVDFAHHRIYRAPEVRIRITESRIVAIFPRGWVDGLQPIEVSHTSASIESGATVAPELRLHFS